MNTATATKLSVRAIDIAAGDTIIEDGRIDLPITGIRPALCGFVIVQYALGGGVCERTLVAASNVTVIRPDAEEAH